MDAREATFVEFRGEHVGLFSFVPVAGLRVAVPRVGSPPPPVARTPATCSSPVLLGERAPLSEKAGAENCGHGCPARLGSYPTRCPTRVRDVPGPPGSPPDREGWFGDGERRVIGTSPPSGTVTVDRQTPAGTRRPRGQPVVARSADRRRPRHLETLGDLPQHGSRTTNRHRRRPPQHRSGRSRRAWPYHSPHGWTNTTSHRNGRKSSSTARGSNDPVSRSASDAHAP